MYLHVVVIAARGLEDCAITRRRRRQRVQCSLSLSRLSRSCHHGHVTPPAIG